LYTIIGSDWTALRITQSPARWAAGVTPAPSVRRRKKDVKCRNGISRTLIGRKESVSVLRESRLPSFWLLFPRG
jgi:hypothetical protein